MRPLILPLLLLAACSGNDTANNESNNDSTGDDAATMAAKRTAAGIVDLADRKPGDEPDYVTVDHILISVKGPKMPDGLSPEDAAALVEKILDELADGAKWFDLKQEHSKDPGRDGVRGGPYAMANVGALRKRDVTSRTDMVNAFGDIGFRLELNEIAVAPYKPQPQRAPGWSPFGYHIIKRVK